MTPQETNVAVAEALGLDATRPNGGPVDKCLCVECWSPAESTGDAFWALKRYCKDNGLRWAMCGSDRGVGCTVATEWMSIVKGETELLEDECAAICAAILAAAGKLEPEETGVAGC